MRGLLARDLGSKRVLGAVLVKRSDILGSKRVLRAIVVKRSDILGC